MTLQTIRDVDEFRQVILNDVAIVMISKDHCSFCERAKPWMKELAEGHDVYMGVVNKDAISTVLESFQVQSYPTFVSFSEGKVVDVFSGDTREEKVREFVSQNVH